jgi:transposase-like protein
MIERLNQSVKQRTKVAKIFANEDSCLRLVSAVVNALQCHRVGAL